MASSRRLFMQSNYKPIENIEWEKCTLDVACYDTKWTAEPDNRSARFQLKVFHLWSGIFHLINFITLLSVGLTQQLFNVQQSLTDTSHNSIGRIPIGVFVLVWVALTIVYDTSYEWIYYHQHNHTMFQSLFDKIVASKHNPYRWIGYTITNSLLIFSIAFVCGVQDVNYLLIFCLMNVCACLFYNWWEKHVGLEMGLMGCFLTIIPWVFIIRQSILSGVGAYENAALSFGVIYEFFICLFLISTFSASNHISAKTYEIMYIVNDMVFKTVISWMILLSL